MHPGCGIQLAFKFLTTTSIMHSEGKKVVEKTITKHGDWVTSPSTARHFVEAQNLLQVPVPAAAGTFALGDDKATLDSIQSLILKSKNIFYVYVNTSGRQKFAKRMGMRGYGATASFAHPQDLQQKIIKCASLQGRRFLEILAPCPHIWRSEPSNTVELTRLATESGLWPLFEVQQGRVAVSYKPQKLEGAHTFNSMQKKLQIDQAALEKNWKLFLLKPFEAE